MTTPAPPRTISLGSVLVVGGCGFVGTHLVDQLLNFPSEDPSSSVSTAASSATPSHDTDTKHHGNANPRLAVPSLRGRYPHYTNTTVSVLDVSTKRNRLPGATYYEADIMNIDDLLRVYRAAQPDVVIDTVSPSMLEGNRELLYRINVLGTRNLLRVAGGEEGDWGGACKAFVYTSSSSVVHDTVSDLKGADEEYPLVIGEKQAEYYTETKALGELEVTRYNATSPTKMLTAAIRPAGIFGERDTTITFKLLEHASRASPFVLRLQLGANDNLFDFTYVGNVAHAHMLAAEALLATRARTADDARVAPLDFERVDGHAFNVTNDAPLYFWDMAHGLWALTDRYVLPRDVIVLPETALTVVGAALEKVYALFGKRPRLTRREVRYSCMTRYYSCEKAKRRLGYRPVVSVDEGVRRAAAYALGEAENVKSKA